jgi:hypothetical protein
MKLYTIEEGKRDWCPRDVPKIFRSSQVAGAIVDFRLMPDCYYKWEGDRDQADVNKIFGLKGLGWGNWPLDQDNIQVGWAPNEQLEGFFNIFLYVNYEKGVKFIEHMLTVKARDHVRVTYNRASPTEWAVRFHNLDGILNGITAPGMIFTSYRKSFPIILTTGTWFGGANNSEGPYGGVTSQFMSMECGVKIVKR